MTISKYISRKSFKSYHLVFIMIKHTGCVKQLIRRLANIVCKKNNQCF